MLYAVLVELNILLVVGIEFVGHLLTLTLIVNHKHTVAHNRSNIEIMLTDSGDIILQKVQKWEKLLGNKEEIAVNADFVSLHTRENIVNNGIHLIRCVAGAIADIELLGLLAVGVDIHIGIHNLVFYKDDFILFVKTDVGKLLVLVSTGIQGLFDQLSGNILGILFLIVPAVNSIDLRAVYTLDRYTVFDSGGSTAVSAGF